MKKKMLLISTIATENSYYIPLNVLVLASALKKINVDSIIVDLQVDKNWKKKIVDSLSETFAIGISAIMGESLQNYEQIKQILLTAKRNIPVIVGGYYASCCYREIIQDEMVDYVIRGFGEHAIVKLAKCILNAETDQSEETIPNLVYKRNGEIIINKLEDSATYKLEDVDYSLIDVEEYLEKNGRKLTYISSYGCVGRCSFCSEQIHSQGKWNGQKAEKIVQDIIELSEKYNLMSFDIVDPNFSTDYKRMIEVAKLLIAKNSSVPIMCNMRIIDMMNLNEEDYLLLKNAGFKKLFIGIESGSEKILKLLNKTYTQEIAYDVCKKADDYGIMTYTNFMHCLPTESMEDSEKTLELSEKIAKNMKYNRQFHHIYIPFPKTKLARGISDKNNIQLYSTYGTKEFCCNMEIKKNVIQRIKKMKQKYPIIFKHQHELI